MIFSQSAYCSCTLKQLGIAMTKTAWSTMVESLKELFMEMESSEESDMNGKEFPYMPLFGSLLYLNTHTRPDIRFSMGILRECVESPTTAHWMAAMDVIRTL